MEKIVQKQLDAYNARDLERFCACYHPEIKIVRLLSGITTITNISEFMELYRNLFASNPKLHCKLRSRIVLESVVIDEEFITGLQRAVDGLHTVAIYGFRDGLIDRVWFPRG